MSIKEIDDAGGYDSGEILAGETEYEDSDGDLDDAIVRKTLLHADDVLSALERQSRKRVLPLSSDDSEPDEGQSIAAFYRCPSGPNPETATATKRAKGISSKPPTQKLSKPSLQRSCDSKRKMPTAEVPSQRLSSDKTPSRKGFESASGSSSVKKPGSSAHGTVTVDNTPKSRYVENDPNSTSHLSSRHEGTPGIMTTLKEISNTLFTSNN